MRYAIGIVILSASTCWADHPLDGPYWEAPTYIDAQGRRVAKPLDMDSVKDKVYVDSDGRRILLEGKQTPKSGWRRLDTTTTKMATCDTGT